VTLTLNGIMTADPRYLCDSRVSCSTLAEVYFLNLIYILAHVSVTRAAAMTVDG